MSSPDSSRSASTSSRAERRVHSTPVRVLLAADAQWLVDELVAALAGPDVSFTVCSEGREVSKVVADRTENGEPFDIAIVDLQIGSMGGMAVTLALRLDESAGVVPHVPVVMLLDRVADVHLARRSGTEGWLVKPLDPLRDATGRCPRCWPAAPTARGSTASRSSRPPNRASPSRWSRGRLTRRYGV